MPSLKPVIREILGTLVLAVAIFLIIQATLQSSIVLGSSMEPGLEDGDRLLISKVAFIWGEPKRGDIIVFSPPGNLNSTEDFIKRIIGMPGEVVEIDSGIVSIHQPDGTLIVLDESEYIVSPAVTPYTSNIIPPDSYFVLGDNRNNSNDSRNGWLAERDDIVGKAWFTIWPSSSWGLVSNHSFP
jgi:signal peptidase I